MKRGLQVITFVLVILLIGFASAGFFDSIRKALTGEATNQPTNVSVTLTGTNAVNITVDNATLTGGVTPIANTIVSSVFYVKVCDPDGVGDINDSSIQAQFQKTGSSTRYNNSCVLIGDLDSYCANYTCTIDNWYWDAISTWTINASATDLGNLTRIYNTTKTFSMNELKAMVISPSELQWTGLSPGQTNKEADNEPTLVNNTGNYNNTISITGLDLYGVTTTTIRFAVGNFTADETDATCPGTALVNNSAQSITGTIANPGNLSAGGGAGQEEIYYCIPSVPYIQSQEYTTDQLGSWTIAY